jgi:uncharacterized protein YraI
MEPTTQHPHWRVKLLASSAGAVAAVSVVIWVVLSGTIGSSGIAASAVADYYIRSGPSTDFPTTGVVRLGQEVRVDCLSGGWARLDDPSPGGYVYGEGLAFEKTPPPC